VGSGWLWNPIMTLLAQAFVREITASAPRLATRLSRALTRANAAQYADQRARIERTGFGGML
jgi:hypothetical protein